MVIQIACVKLRVACAGNITCTTLNMIMMGGWRLAAACVDC